MKKSILTMIIVHFLAMINSCGIIDNKESKVHDFLEQKVNSESQGSIKLDNLKKTNGYDQELMGMKMYILEWAADISVQREIWKAGNNLEGYWQSFSVTFDKPEFWDAYASVNMPKHLGTGALIHLTGESKLHKTEQGWIVEELSVKTYQILNEGVLLENKFLGNWTNDNFYFKIIKDANGIKYIETDLNNQVIDDKFMSCYMIYNNGKLSGKSNLYSHGEFFPYHFTLELIDDSNIILHSNDASVVDGNKYHKR